MGIDLVSLAIWVIVIVAVASVVYWFVTKSGIVIPYPLKIVLWAVVAVLCVLLLANLLGMGPAVVRVR